jgi:hypothetical protein
MSMSMGVYDMGGLVDIAEEFGGMRKKNKKGGNDKVSTWCALYAVSVNPRSGASDFWLKT